MSGTTIKTHDFPLRIYYEDTDAGGIVYHPNYLSFAERARCEFLREIGHECSDIEDTLGLQFVVKHADIDYIRPARLDDALNVRSSITYMRNTSFQFTHDIQKAGATICKILVTLVCVDAKEIKPMRIPDILREKLQPFCESNG